MIEVSILIISAITAICFIAKYLKIKKILSDEKEFFINTLSHDFRVSLIAQIRGLELLKKSEALFENYELISDIEEGTKYTFDMCSCLLNLYELGEKNTKINPKYINLSNIINSAILYNDAKLKEKYVTIENACISTFAYIDFSSICKAVQILIRAAILYSFENSKILCLTENSVKNSVIKIRYIGKNLTQEEKKRMFSKKSTYSCVGQGLMMSLCKKLIEANNGTIEVINNEKNLNEFRIILPKYSAENRLLKQIFKIHNLGLKVSLNKSV